MSNSTTDVNAFQQNKGKHKRVMKLLNLPTGPGAAPYEVQPQPSWKDKGRGLSNRKVHSSSVCVLGSLSDNDGDGETHTHSFGRLLKSSKTVC